MFKRETPELLHKKYDKREIKDKWNGDGVVIIYNNLDNCSIPIVIDCN